MLVCATADQHCFERGAPRCGAHMLLKGLVLLVGLRCVPGLQRRLPGHIFQSRSSSITTGKVATSAGVAPSSGFHRMETDTVVPIYWYTDVSSTMDVARDIILGRKSSSSSTVLDAFAVVAYSQSMGRGTRGRSWFSSRGNLYLTVVVNTKDLPIPLTLVPLRIATLIYHEIEQVLRGTGDNSGSSSSSTSSTNSNANYEYTDVHLKWPNDILINKKKICGILMEMEDDNLLIGIGCNVMVAPIIKNEGNNGGRQSTCLKDHIRNKIDVEPSVDEECKYPLTDRMAVGIVNRLAQWILSSSDCADKVVADFSERADWGNQYLRDGNIEVVPKRINADGTLEVCFQDGQKKTLIADYLW